MSQAVVASLRERVERARDHLGADDRTAWARLLDAEDDAYLARRDDLFVLGAMTVHRGIRRT